MVKTRQNKGLLIKSSLTLDSPQSTILLIVGALFFGFVIRYIYLFGATFPLNDGGMFFQMTKDLIANGFRLPEFTDYNGGHIPYGYPPLGFYLAGGVSQLLRIDLFTVFLYLPVAFNMLTIPVMYALAREVTANRFQSALAMYAFALFNPGYTWQIMGGGITRAPGFFFALLALLFIFKMMKSKRIWQGLPAVLFIALSGWFHLEMLWYAAISGLLIMLYYWRSWKGFFALAGTGLLAGLLMAPYWLTVILRHGLDTFLAAFQSGGFIPAAGFILLVRFNFGNEILFTFGAVFIVFGMMDCLHRKNWLLPAWLLLIIILDQRSMERSLMPVSAALIAIGLDWIIVLMIRFSRQLFPNDKFNQPGEESITLDHRLNHPLSMALVLFLFTQAIFSAMLYRMLPSNYLAPIPADELKAMTWIKENTPEDARFVSIADIEGWPTDSASEWFPVITGRKDVVTVQGTEWLSNGGFDRAVEAYSELKSCRNSDIDCLDEWAEKYDKPYDYLFFNSREKLGKYSVYDVPLEAAVAHSTEYELVFKNECARVYRRVER